MNKGKLLTEEYFKENTKKFVTEDFFKENTKKFVTTDYLDHKLKDFVTKDYLDSKLDIYVTKDYLDQSTKKMLDEIKQYNKDLMSGFQDKIYGMGDYVKFVDDKVNKLGNRVSILEQTA